MIDVLNLGAGVQSSTVLLMSLEGELPKIDHAIFADTGWEPAAVYQQLDWLQKKAEASGVKVWRVSKGNIKADWLRYAKDGGPKHKQPRTAAIPLFTINPDGSHGMIRRQCTKEYKIEQIQKCIKREIFGLKTRERWPTEVKVRQWFGISLDEQQRMREPQEKWAVYWYPLVDRRMTRTTCFQWLAEHGYPEAPRSACIGCPYHSNREWRDMKEQRPDDWKEAVEFDRLIRNSKEALGQWFIHSDRKPLDECNLWRDCDENQLPLFDMVDECSGMCGV